jgi:hypothetical protein
MTDVEIARKYRSDIEVASSFFIANRDRSLQYGSDEIVWEDLEQLPLWANWDKSNRDQLIRIAGTVFMLPSIRLWLESERIEEVQSIIGKDVYEYLLNYTYINTIHVSFEEVVDIKKILESTGASVLLSTLQESIRIWFIELLPQTNKLINTNVAIEIYKHALYVFENTCTAKPAQQVTMDEL